MKIALFTDSYRPNTDGVAEVTEIIAKEMTKKEHEITIVCPKRTSSVVNKEGIKIISVKSHPIKLYREHMICFKTPEYLDKLHDFSDYDLIHLQTNVSVAALGFLTALRFSIPVSCTFHTNIADFAVNFFRKEILSNKKNIMYKFITKTPLILPGLRNFAGFTMWNLTKNFHNAVPVTTVPSFYCRQQLRSHGVTNPIKVIYNPIKKRIPKKDYSKKYNLEKDFIILHVGRLSVEKRVHTLINIMQKLRNVDNIKAVVCSDGPLRKVLEKKSEKLGISDKIIFTGFIPRDELSWLYKKCDIVVNFGLCETFNICATEALFYGKPVLLSDDGPHKEIVRNNGYLIRTSENEVVEYAEKILELYNNKELYNKMSKNSKKMSKKYSYFKVIDEYEEFFKESTNNIIERNNYVNFIKYVSNLAAAMNTLIFTLSLEHKRFDKYLDNAGSFLRSFKKKISNIKENFFK